MPPRKRVKSEGLSLCEPPHSKQQIGLFTAGTACFRNGDYWEAHEAWEGAWQLMGNGPEDDAEIVLRGLIQLAAAYHCRQQGRMNPAQRNLGKGREKLLLYKGLFWGIDIPQISAQLNDGLPGTITLK
jgi:hypothetical protein